MVIDTLQLDIVVNNKGTTARINNTTKSLQKLHNVIEQINGAGGVNSAFNGGSSSGRGARSSQNVASNLNKALNIGSIVGKLYFVRNVTKQLGQNMAKVVQYGIDYEETLNLWQVAMRGNISQARTFVSEMNRAYGVSEATLMNYQAIFRNMLSALGNISEASSYAISEALTQMALDFASLYNTSVESAMTKFQAVLSGQVRPIRTAGYDITEQTLFQLYQQIGGTKTVRQLNQTEKQLLRILAVFKQMETVGATGDLAKTLSSSANQLRIMKEQAKDFATWVGISFNLLLQESGILIDINAYLIVLKELAKSIAFELGYNERNYMIDFAEGAEEANKEVDKLQGKLLGFDKFQVLNSAGGEDVGIEQELLNALSAYEGIIDQANNKAFTKAEEILARWGFHMEEVKNEAGEVVGYVWKANDGEKTALKRLKEIGKSILGIFTFIGLMTKPWLVFVGAIETAYFTNEDFRKSMNEAISALSSTGLTVFQTLSEIFIAMSPIILEIVEGFAGIISWLDEMGLLDDVIYLVVGALLAWKAIQIGNWIGSVYSNIQKAIPKIKAFVTTLKDAKYASEMLAVGGMLLLIDATRELFGSWNDLSGFEVAIRIFKLLAGAAMIAATAVGAFHTTWTVGLAAGAIAVGIATLMGALSSVESKTRTIETHANGGLATKGSLFYAGEAGPELVTQTSGGNSTIMNMRQLEDAVARGFIRGFAATEDGHEDDNITDVYVDGQRLFNIMRKTANRNGYDFVKV